MFAEISLWKDHSSSEMFRTFTFLILILATTSSEFSSMVVPQQTFELNFNFSICIEVLDLHEPV